jgi:hypothetical protein
MILYLRDPKNSTPELLDTINSFSNVAGYKIHFEKLDEQIEKEYRKTIPFTIALKYLWKPQDRVLSLGNTADPHYL